MPTAFVRKWQNSSPSLFRDYPPISFLVVSKLSDLNWSIQISHRTENMLDVMRLWPDIVLA